MAEASPLSPRRCKNSPPIRRLLASVGFPQTAGDAAAAAAGDAIAALGATGGGLGGCEVCGALRLIVRLQRELVRLRADRERCGASAAPGSRCASRLDYQITRLERELRRRRQRVSAEDVELERTLRGVEAALSACDELALAASGSAHPPPLHAYCVLPQRIALRRYRDALQGEVAARVRMLQTAALRRQYACLWQFRAEGVTDVVGRVLAPADGAAADGLPPALRARLTALTTAAPVVLFMKGEPDAPRCGFSKRVVAALRAASIEFNSFDILTDDDVRQGMKTFSDWPTFPQLYAGGELVGGCDIVEEMAGSGELGRAVAEMVAVVGE
jgi:Grx4 family monothiol glutaredoxin